MTLADLIDLWKYAVALKFEERRGWRKLRLNRIESVADHSFALGLLALLEAGKRNYDVEKAVKLALMHDLEEAIIGDLTPRDKRIRGAARVRKERRLAVEELLAKLPAKDRKSYARLWTDLRLQRTKEARLVHDLDKLEMAFQAREYAKKVGQERVRDFYQSATKAIRDPALRQVLNEVRRS